MAVDHLSVAILYYFISNNNLGKINSPTTIQDPNECIYNLAIYNGWDSSSKNAPSDIGKCFALLITCFRYGHSLNGEKIQTMIGNGHIFQRYFNNGVFENWNKII